MWCCGVMNVIYTERQLRIPMNRHTQEAEALDLRQENVGLVYTDKLQVKMKCFRM